MEEIACDWYNKFLKKEIISNLEEATKAANVHKDELDQVAGTAEDEFTESILLIRERELLYGSKSLLSKFAPIISHICSNTHLFKVSI